jgi:hypothetical protein
VPERNKDTKCPTYACLSFVAERISDIYKSILPLNVPYNLLEGTGRKEFELGKLHFMSVLVEFYIRGASMGAWSTPSFPLKCLSTATTIYLDLR